MNNDNRTAAIAMFLLLSALSFGCGSRNPTSSPALDVLNRTEPLYAAYLKGDVDTASRSLRQIVQLIEESRVLVPNGRASLLSLNYCRLYVLETRLGNTAEADAALIKVRYWHLVALELAGNRTDKAVAEVLQLDSHNLVRLVDDNDKANNKGKLPAYFKDLTKP